jgi:hypothetical protein
MEPDVTQQVPLSRADDIIEQEKRELLVGVTSSTSVLLWMSRITFIDQEEL